MQKFLLTIALVGFVVVTMGAYFYYSVPTHLRQDSEEETGFNNVFDYYRIFDGMGLIDAGSQDVIEGDAISVGVLEPEEGDFSYMNSVEFGKYAVQISPLDWGNLVTWLVGNRGEIMNGKYKDKDLLRGWGSGESGYAVRNFSEYPYLGNLRVAPYVSLSAYPEEFRDDVEMSEPGSLTAEQKKRIYAPLLEIHENKGLSGIKVEQKRLLLPSDEQDDINMLKLLRGLWWGNTMAMTDKLRAQYYETGSFRGVGFFDLSTQDPEVLSVISYRVILIDPTLRLLVELYLPIDGIPSLKRFYNPGEQQDELFKTSRVWKEDFPELYKYIESVNKDDGSDLGKFLSEVNSLISTLELTKSEQAGELGEEWQTYQNNEFGFELNYPKNFELSENNEWSQLVPFFQVVFSDKTNPAKSFQVKVTLNKGMSEPLSIHLDHPVDYQDVLGNEKANVFIIKNGYCDGPSCAEKVIALKTEKDKKFYILEFQGAQDLSESFLVNVKSSFRFIQK